MDNLAGYSHLGSQPTKNIPSKSPYAKIVIRTSRPCCTKKGRKQKLAGNNSLLPGGMCKILYKSFTIWQPKEAERQAEKRPMFHILVRKPAIS